MEFFLNRCIIACVKIAVMVMPQIDIVKASLSDQDELKNLNPSNTGLASQTRC